MWNQEERSLKSAEVGDKLTVANRGDASQYDFRTVAKVTKTSLTDDKGDRWSLSWGEPWGTGGDAFRTGPIVRMYRDGDKEDKEQALRDARLRRNRRRLSEYTLWQNMPEHVVDDVLALVAGEQHRQANQKKAE